jgi:hypothetical protein
MRIFVFSLLLAFAACASLTAPMPAVTPGNSNLLATGNNGTDPNRQVQTTGRPCVLACMNGYKCNPNTGGCDPVITPVETRDAGPAWLP